MRRRHRTFRPRNCRGGVMWLAGGYSLDLERDNLSKMEEMRKILVIEDDENNREIIQQILADRFQVLTAQDGEEGLEKARVEQPDVIVLDIVMPKMDGIAACEILRKEEMTRHIPIIILTG